MKKLISILLAACLLICGVPLAKADTEPIPIASREELEHIAENPNGSYCLTADIDMGPEPWQPIPFSGRFDGDGHTLYNLHVRDVDNTTVTTFDGNYKEYETVTAGLFSVVSDAEIRDLRLIGADVQITTDRDCFAATLAGYAAFSTFTNCMVETRGHLTLTATNVGIGGLVGFCVECEIRNCCIDAELVFTDTNKDNLCEEFLGGVYACGCGIVEDCTVCMRGYAEVYGYAHSGGIVGMHKLRRGISYPSIVARNEVDAEIWFYEITRSRRAYSAALLGEDAGGKCRRSQNRITFFRSHETRTPTRQSPEKCEVPVYDAVLTAPTCTEWGYTTNVCRACGYRYQDRYTPPVHRYERSIQAPTCTETGTITYLCSECGDCYMEPIPAGGHTPGEWETVIEPQLETEGWRQRVCTLCGEVLETEPIPAFPRVEAKRVELSEAMLNLNYGQNGFLSATVFPADVADPSVVWTSSDDNVAKVLPDGTVETGACGTAVLICSSADGCAEATCTVTVSYSFRQKLIRYLLFGWVWDRH